jgi:hypothetical protein
MATRAEILQKLRGLHGKQVQCQPAVIKSVDKDNLTCTVIMLDELEMPGVRLQASIANAKPSSYHVNYPEPDSSVLIAMVGGEESAGEYYIAATSEIDGFDIKIEAMEISFTKDSISLTDGKSTIELKDGKVLIEAQSKVEIKNASESLKSIIGDLLTELQAMQLITPTGPGTVNPVTIAKFVAINVRLNTFLA